MLSNQSRGQLLKFFAQQGDELGTGKLLNGLLLLGLGVDIDIKLREAVLQ